MIDDREPLIAYGRTLVAAGFEVWHESSGYRDAGYLVYRNPANGCWGSLQKSIGGLGSWAHLMPLTPSREYGSSMHVEVKPRAPRTRPTTLDPFTVEAARQCASPTNWNDVIGTRPNAMKPGYLSGKATPLHEVAS